MGDLALDLGTAHLRVWGPAGELMREPAVATADRVRIGWGRARRVLGRPALALAREQPAIALVRPLCDGVLTDPDAAVALVRAGIARARRLLRPARPRLCFAVAPLLPDMQRRALRRLALDVGARGGWTVPAPIAVLAGLDVDVDLPCGQMVIDVGAGTAQASVVSLSSLVVARGVARGGDHMDRAIEAFVERRFGARLGPGEAERLRLEVGVAGPEAEARSVHTAVRDASGKTRSVEVHSAEIRAAISPVLEEVQELAREALAVTPPELASDVADAGIRLCGGAAALPGFDTLLAQATGVPVLRVPDPIGAAARGTAALLCASKARQALLTEL